jgi:hypothetical protein
VEARPSVGLCVETFTLARFQRTARRVSDACTLNISTQNASKNKRCSSENAALTDAGRVNGLMSEQLASTSTPIRLLKLTVLTTVEARKKFSSIRDSDRRPEADAQTA